MKKFLTSSTMIFSILMLVSCASAPTVTSAPSETPSPRPTQTPTQTHTPTPTSEPTLSPELQEKFAAAGIDLTGTQYDLALNQDNPAIVLMYTDPETEEKIEIPELQFDIEGNFWTRTYQFENANGEVSELTVDGKLKEIKVTKDGENTVIDLPGWKIVNGNWVREKVISPEGEETKFPKYSVDEVVTMLIQDGEKVTEENWEEPTSETRESTLRNARDLLGLTTTRNKTVNFKGVGFEFSINQFVFHNLVLIDGSEKPAISYVYFNLKNGQSLVVWKLNGTKKEFMVDANLGGDLKPLTLISESLK